MAFNPNYSNFNLLYQQKDFSGLQPESSANNGNFIANNNISVTPLNYEIGFSPIITQNNTVLDPPNQPRNFFPLPQNTNLNAFDNSHVQTEPFVNSNNNGSTFHRDGEDNELELEQSVKRIRKHKQRIISAGDLHTVDIYPENPDDVENSEKTIIISDLDRKNVITIFPLVQLKRLDESTADDSNRNMVLKISHEWANTKFISLNYPILTCRPRSKRIAAECNKLLVDNYIKVQNFFNIPEVSNIVFDHLIHSTRRVFFKDREGNIPSRIFHYFFLPASKMFLTVENVSVIINEYLRNAKLNETEKMNQSTSINPEQQSDEVTDFLLMADDPSFQKQLRQGVQKKSSSNNFYYSSSDDDSQDHLPHKKQKKETQKTTQLQTPLTVSSLRRNQELQNSTTIGLESKKSDESDESDNESEIESELEMFEDDVERIEIEEIKNLRYRSSQDLKSNLQKTQKELAIRQNVQNSQPEMSDDASLSPSSPFPFDFRFTEEGEIVAAPSANKVNNDLNSPHIHISSNHIIVAFRHQPGTVHHLPILESKTFYINKDFTSQIIIQFVKDPDNFVRKIKISQKDLKKNIELDYIKTEQGTTAERHKKIKDYYITWQNFLIEVMKELSIPNSDLINNKTIFSNNCVPQSCLASSTVCNLLNSSDIKEFEQEHENLMTRALWGKKKNISGFK